MSLEAVVEVGGMKYARTQVDKKEAEYCRGCVNENQSIDKCLEFPKCSELDSKGCYSKLYIFKEMQ